MDFLVTVSFLGLMFLLALMPSASVLLVISRTVSNGTLAGVFTVLGIILGDTVFICIALSGLSELVIHYASFFPYLKYFGVLCLLLIALSCFRDNRKSIDLGLKPSTKNQQRNFKSLMMGFSLTIVDVKALVFYFSIFPIFFDLHQLNLSRIIIIVVMAEICVGCAKFVHVYFARKAKVKMKNILGEQLINYLIGMLLIGAGVILAFSI